MKPQLNKQLEKLRESNQSSFCRGELLKFWVNQSSENLNLFDFIRDYIDGKTPCPPFQCSFCRINLFLEMYRVTLVNKINPLIREKISSQIPIHESTVWFKSLKEWNLPRESSWVDFVTSPFLKCEFYCTHRLLIFSKTSRINFVFSFKDYIHQKNELVITPFVNITESKGPHWLEGYSFRGFEEKAKDFLNGGRLTILVDQICKFNQR